MSDQEQLTPQQEREYVYDAWEQVDYQWSGSTYRPTLMIRLPLIWWEGLGTGYFETEEAGWHAAYLFTKDRERKIAEVREEIEYVDSFSRMPKRNGTYAEHPVWKRILAREQAALADLLRGWREKGDGNGQR